MELPVLLERLRLAHLEPHLDAVGDQDAARELDDKSVLTAALVTGRILTIRPPTALLDDKSVLTTALVTEWQGR